MSPICQKMEQQRRPQLIVALGAAASPIVAEQMWGWAEAIRLDSVGPDLVRLAWPSWANPS